ncbi:transporter substrate-binding domain-containing protein [uncultured Treponema sp.]|uniref:substrate-binding periplasmic protein n=1 Tax=uncultured Treponema sp. TaxID=162155 RepID=UPI0025EA6501|nr:transporter substrate-binding domain-containing protein [uncultured Treponema sp.]
MGVPSDRCPVFYIDRKTKEITGIGVDLMRTAAKYAGYTVTFKIIEEKNLKEALDSEKYDVLMPFGSAVTSSSGKATVVSENLMNTPFTLVTGEKYSISSINSLRVGMLSSLGAGAETIKELFPTIQIVMYDTMEECVDSLRRGEVDALLHNSYVWSYVLQKPYYEDLEVNPLSMFSMDFCAD